MAWEPDHDTVISTLLREQQQREAKKEKKRRPTGNEQRELILALAAERLPLRDQLKGNNNQERSITPVGFTWASLLLTDYS